MKVVLRYMRTNVVSPESLLNGCMVAEMIEQVDELYGDLEAGCTTCVSLFL